MATQTREVLVTNGTGGTTLLDASTGLAGRSHVRIQNQGPNAIHVTTGGLTPVVGIGIKVAADASIDFPDFFPGQVIQAIAETAAQVSANATIVVEW